MTMYEPGNCMTMYEPAQLFYSLDSALLPHLGYIVMQWLGDIDVQVDFIQ